MTKEEDEYVAALVRKSTLKVDTSEMAKQLQEFYIRQELCKLCKIEGTACPYNYDTIACQIGNEPVN